jgi:hypothetical protein
MKFICQRSIILQLVIFQVLFLWNQSLRVILFRKSWIRKSEAIMSQREKEPFTIPDNADIVSPIPMQANASFFGRIAGTARRGLSFLNPFKKKDSTLTQSQLQLTAMENKSIPTRIVVFFRRRLLNIWGSKSQMWPVELSEEMGINYMKKRSNGIKSPYVEFTKDRSEQNWFISKFVRVFNRGGVNPEEDDDGNLRVLLRRGINENKRTKSDSDSSVLAKLSSLGSNFRQSIGNIRSSVRDQVSNGPLQVNPSISDLDLNDMFELFDVTKSRYS